MSAKKILLVLFGASVVALTGAAIAIWILLPRYVEEQVLRAAKERGVTLKAGKISFGLSWVRVSRAEIALIGVPSLGLRAGVIEADVVDLAPARVRMSDVLASTGDVAALARELPAWARAHGPKLREPLAVKSLTVRVAGEGAAPPRLLLERAELRVENQRSELLAKRALFLGRELGELRARHGEQRARVDVTLRQSALDNPQLSIGVDAPDASDSTVHVALAPIALGRLGEVLGVALPEPEVVASGSLGARIPVNLDAGGAVSGAVDGLLKGYVPPHPVELQGFVFGDTTTVSTRYSVDLAAMRVLLEGTRVKAGAFELVGGGEIRAEGSTARLSLILSGQLPCNALAGAMAESRLGRSLGKVTGKAARQVVSGGVGVRVAIDATASELERARVLRTITPGCGLKPLSLEELVKLGELLPEALDPKVARDFEELMQKSLPGLLPKPGTALPLPEFEVSLPGLPTFGARPVKPTPTGSASGRSPAR